MWSLQIANSLLNPWPFVPWSGLRFQIPTLNTIQILQGLQKDQGPATALPEFPGNVQHRLVLPTQNRSKQRSQILLWPSFACWKTKISMRNRNQCMRQGGKIRTEWNKFWGNLAANHIAKDYYLSASSCGWLSFSGQCQRLPRIAFYGPCSKRQVLARRIPHLALNLQEAIRTIRSIGPLKACFSQRYIAFKKLITPNIKQASKQTQQLVLPCDTHVRTPSLPAGLSQAAWNQRLTIGPDSAGIQRNWSSAVWFLIAGRDWDLITSLCVCWTMCQIVTNYSLTNLFMDSHWIKVWTM